MLNKGRHLVHIHRLALALLAATMLFGMASLASAQGTTPPVRDNDTTVRELRNFDAFLDDHPGIAKDLTSNPNLINDPNYLSQHPELQEFLEKHPGVREELKENPKQFMNRERRFERSGRDITRGELGNFDRFLDDHPGIANDLKSNPNLVNDPNYVSQHPELQQFLSNHPGVQDELKENPKRFLNRENAFERSGRDITPAELRNFDRFLDNHPQIEKDLRSNPNLVNDPNYLSQHQELQQFLSNHPGVQDELKENPKRFLNRENAFERSGKDITRGELRNFDQFLDKHPETDEQLRKNPRLINDPKYVAAHPELKEFLDKHPGVRAELKEHPRYFMHRERQFESHERGEHRRRRDH